MSIAFLVYSHLIAGALGAAVAALLLWRPKRRRANFTASYFKGNGEPQPFSWSPDRAIGNHEPAVFAGIDEWRRSKGDARRPRPLYRSPQSKGGYEQ